MLIHMMACPHCGGQIELDKVLKNQILEEHSAQLKQEADKRAKALNEATQKLEEEREKFKLESNIARQEYKDVLVKDRARMAQEAALKAKAEMEAILNDFKDQLKQKDLLIHTIQKSEVELMKQTNELQMRGKALELEVMQRLETEKQKIFQESNRIAEDKHRFELASKQKTIEDMKTVIESLNNKVKDNSQQRQGEIAEIEIENSLKATYPNDEVVPIPKGVRGADINLHVKSGNRDCGSILIEAKQTKNWSNAWIQKLKQDQIDAKSEIAVIITSVMPDDGSPFLKKEGVWVVDYKTFPALIYVLRSNLIDIARLEIMKDNRTSKMSDIYKYVGSVEFTQKIQSVMDTVCKMQNDLTNEKSAIEKLWARREKQIQAIASTVSGVSGNIDGLLGTESQPLKIAQ